MRPLAALGTILWLLGTAWAAPPRCPNGFFYFTGFSPVNSFDRIADLRYYNRGKPYFITAARQKCSKFPYYAHDLLNFGARFTRLCLDQRDNAIYSFRTPDPCRGGKQVNGTMFLGVRPTCCFGSGSRLEPVPDVWEQAAVSLNPDKQAPLRCPKTYFPVSGEAAKPYQEVLRAMLFQYFTQTEYIKKLIDRLQPNVYCDDAFKTVGFSGLEGCIKKAEASKDLAMVVAHAVVTFQCYVPPAGAGITTPIRRIGLTVKGNYELQCQRPVRITWN